MLTDPKLRSQVDALWDKFWARLLLPLYKPVLDMFGADVVERWFTKEEVEEILTFANRFAAQ